MDRIRLKNLILFARLGVTAWEKKGVQKVSLDVELALDLSTAAREDRISAAVDYQEVCKAIEAIGTARKYHLIEALAEAVAGTVLENFPRVERVIVRLRKTSLPFEAHLEHVEVELERGRGAGA